MKLPKTLLAALLTGITLQAVESCTKKKDDPPKEQKEKEKEGEKEGEKHNWPNCPACGMG